MFGPQRDLKSAPLAEPAVLRAPGADNDTCHHGSQWQALSMLPVARSSNLEIAASDSAHEQEAEQIADAPHDLEVTATHSDRPSIESEYAPPSANEAISSPASPLDDATRLQMESQFGEDFSDVRIHDNAASNRANEQLDSRAFTAGRDIAFAAGQYAPQTTAGRKLIAHELAHVSQQSRTHHAIVQRAPALSGYKTTEKVADSVAGDVDKALEESPAITRYVDKKSLRKTAGKIQVEQSEVFAAKYKKYAAKHKDMPEVKDVPGYTDRENDRIVLKLNSADVEAAVHEAVHYNSSTSFAGQFGHHLNEGMTEFFTEKVLDEQKLGSGRAYRDELKYAKAFITSVGEDAAGKAYFLGDTNALKQATDALNKAGSYSKWRTAAFGDKPEDWRKAATVLKQAMGR